MNILIIIIIGVLVLGIVWRLGSKRYSIPCPSYLSWMVEMDNPFAKENQSAKIIEHLEIKENMLIADIGCGPGRVTIPLSKVLGPTSIVVAMDIQEEMLEKVRRKAANLTNIELRHGGIGEGKLEENKYDYILLVNVLGEIPEQEVALEEIFRALKSGGILSITETIFDPHFQRESKVRELTKGVGFKKFKFFGKWYSYTLHIEKD